MSYRHGNSSDEPPPYNYGGGDQSPPSNYPPYSNPDAYDPQQPPPQRSYGYGGSPNNAGGHRPHHFPQSDDSGVNDDHPDRPDAQSRRFHMPTSLFSSHHEPSNDVPGDFVPKPTFKIFCRANPQYFLTVRDSQVVLAPSDARDDKQHWFKDDRYSTSVRDEEGSYGFSLINKACGEALKHDEGEGNRVKVTFYNPDVFDENILWSESKEIVDGFKAIRMVTNVHLNMDAFQGDEHSGGIRDGTEIVLWSWKTGDNQIWKIEPY